MRKTDLLGSGSSILRPPRHAALGFVQQMGISGESGDRKPLAGLSEPLIWSKRAASGAPYMMRGSIGCQQPCQLIPPISGQPKKAGERVSSTPGHPKKNLPKLALTALFSSRDMILEKISRKTCKLPSGVAYCDSLGKDE